MENVALGWVQCPGDGKVTAGNVSYWHIVVSHFDNLDRKPKKVVHPTATKSVNNPPRNI